MPQHIRFEGRIALIVQMLLRSLNDTTHFLVFLSVYIVGFALCFCMVFGTTVECFSTLEKSIQTLFYLEFAIERYDYAMLSTLRPVLAPILITVYLTLTVLILFNVFIALLMDAYTLVKQDNSMSYSLTEEIAEGWHRRTARGAKADVADVLERHTYQVV